MTQATWLASKPCREGYPTRSGEPTWGETPMNSQREAVRAAPVPQQGVTPFRGNAVSRALSSLVLLGTLASAACNKPPPKTVVEDENASAFSELEGGGGEKPAASEEEEEKGPVYPAPFTAEQIRDATRDGRTYRYKVEVPNEPVREYSITFRNVDDGGAEISSSGNKSKRMGWLALQRQSEFPKDKVTTYDEKLKTPAGKFECVVYEVAGDDGETWSFFFAKNLPGAPVFFYAERDGKRLRTTTLIEHIPGKKRR